MITAADLDTAERLLKIVVGDGMNVQGQFVHYQVDRTAYESFHQELMSLFISRAQQANVQIPNRLVPILNTIMAHHFLVGVVAAKIASESEPL